MQAAGELRPGHKHSVYHCGHRHGERRIDFLREKQDEPAECREAVLIRIDDPLDIAPRQVKIAEDYIEANWNSAITVETLADVVGVSARSVFNSFRQSRGYTPMQFAKSVRLRRAHLRLSNPTPDTTVTGVALECGFQNMGHFADDFKSQFGELPSETLKRGRMASRQ